MIVLMSTESDSETGKKLIHAQQAVIARTDDEIKELESSLSVLRAQRVKQLEHLEDLFEICPPIFSVPNEILAKIFIQFYALNGQASNRNTSVFVLCLVCSRWWQVALKTPQLWRSLDFTITTTDDKFTSEIGIKYTTAWLERAGAGPLQARIESDLEVFSNCAGSLSTTTLHTFSHMIDDLTLILMHTGAPRQNGSSHSTFLHELFPLHGTGHSQWHALRTLRLQAGWPWNLPFSNDLTQYSAPIMSVSLPWSQLTSLYLDTSSALHRIPFTAVLSIVPMCKHLLHLSLTMEGVDVHSTLQEIEHAPSTIHTLPVLRSLRVFFDAQELAVELLKRLTLPSLEHLDILVRDSSWSGQESNMHEALVALKERSALKLHSFRLQDASTVPRVHDLLSGQLLEFLANMPSLYRLDLLTIKGDGISMIEPLLLEMTAVPVAHAVAPFLVEFMCRNDPQYHDNTFEDLDLILSMIESRCDPNPQANDNRGSKPNSHAYLKKVILDFDLYGGEWHKMKEYKDRLDVCRESGMEISYDWPSYLEDLDSLGIDVAGRK